MNLLKNRTAIVTGASRGIGYATAKRLLEEGAKVCIADIVDDPLKSAVDQLKKEGYEVMGCRADVTNEQEVEHMTELVNRRWGRIDILVNNAGLIRDNLLFKMKIEDWQMVMDVHLKGSFLCSRAVQKYMVTQKFGRIINMSSISALGNRGQANYATAKAGLLGFTKTLAIELGKFRITCNAVAPGFIDTEMTRMTAARMGMDFDDFINDQLKLIPAGRAGKPEDIANAVLFFALEQSSFVNGQVLYVSGGPNV